MQVDQIIQQLTSKKITSFKQWITEDFNLFLEFCSLRIGMKNEIVHHISRLGWKLNIKKGNAQGVATLLRSITKAEFVAALKANGVQNQSQLRKLKYFYNCMHSGIGHDYMHALPMREQSVKGNLSKKLLEKGSAEDIANAIIKTRNSANTLRSVILKLDDPKRSKEIFYIVADHQIENRSGIQQTKKLAWTKARRELDEALKDPYKYLIKTVEHMVKNKKTFSFLFSITPVLILRERSELTIYYGFRNGYLERKRKDGKGAAGGWTSEFLKWTDDQWISFMRNFKIEHTDLHKFKGLKELLISRCVLHKIYSSGSSFAWLADESLKVAQGGKNQKKRSKDGGGMAA